MSYFLRQHDFRLHYKAENSAYLHKFVYYYCRRPDFEFMDMDIEASKAMLAEKIDNFLDPLSNAFSCDSIDGFAGFPKEWEQKNWHFYLEFVNRCNELASVAWEAYEDFIRTGRRKLCLPFEE